ncbi:MAG: tRNA (guanosine(37)-N1)-methyltransferase TrmD [Acholeplasmataceae bacterium]|nr:MAG: tRNA (guanosine(37)-N1)-methyltransferase TrmD [Acholeplasmataceae bacterium]
MIIDIITIFPDFFTPFLETSMIRKALEKQYVKINIHNLRDHTTNKHKKIDDTPYGGGAGMLMTIQPFEAVISALKTKDSVVILLSPQGELLSQPKAIELATKTHIILLCGHYEGVDARIQAYIDMELSIGDYVLTGGEIPAMIVADAITRLIPGVLHEESAQADSLQNGLLKYPQYTKPEHYKGMAVPDVLLSGHHQQIESWRKQEQLRQTLVKRPDLLKKVKLDPESKTMLEAIKQQLKDK